MKCLVHTICVSIVYSVSDSECSTKGNVHANFHVRVRVQHVDKMSQNQWLLFGLVLATKD